MKDTELLLVASARALVRMKSILGGLGRAPEDTGRPYFEPYVDVFREIAKERGLGVDGMRSGEAFAELWDARSRDFIEQKTAKLNFSVEEVDQLRSLLGEWGEWLQRNFPEAD